MILSNRNEFSESRLVMIMYKGSEKVQNVLNSSLLSKNCGSLGILICGHGSRSHLAVAEFSGLVEAIKKRLPGIPVEYGYLEFARPILSEALDRLREKSVKKVLAVPAMLFAAGHVKNDIPSVLNTYSAKTGLEIVFGRELGIDPLMIAAAGERLKEVINKSSPIPLTDTILVVVGRGSSDPDANSNVSKITRMLVESFGFGWGETVYSGVTFPLVEPGLRYIASLGFSRIIVFPYFLFSGVLLNRIRTHTDKVANDFPKVEFLLANYLRDHPLVVDTFLDRIHGILQGDTSMNCSLCKYRSKVLGFEKEVGLLQQSHHHHVEGLDLSKRHFAKGSDCSAETEHQSPPVDLQEHSHEHYPYPNANHPLGPKSLRDET